MKLKEQNTKTEESESKLVMKQTAIDNLVTKCDDNKQYSQRSCMRTHGLDFNSNKNDVVEKVARCYREVGIEFN